MIDEAHQLEDIVSEAAGRLISPTRLQAAARAAAAVLADRGAPTGVEEAATVLHAVLEPLVGDRLVDGLDADTDRSIDMIRGRVNQLLDALRAVPKDAPADVAAKALRARQAATSLLDDIDYLRWPTDDEVLWVDGPTATPASVRRPSRSTRCWPSSSGRSEQRSSRRRHFRRGSPTPSDCRRARPPSTSAARSTTSTTLCSTARPTSPIPGPRATGRPGSPSSRR
ncbi:MAG: hypothetical protein R2695_12970 [Acidimicrobiales bacterium]